MRNVTNKAHFHFVSILICTLSTASASAAEPTARPRRINLPYWSVENGFESSVQLHNNLVKGLLTVQPVLLSRERYASVRWRTLPSTSEEPSRIRGSLSATEARFSSMWQSPKALSRWRPPFRSLARVSSSR